jgi:amidase
MITLEDYASRDGLGLAALVASGEVTPREIADAALAAIAQVNPALNAVLQTLPAEAMAAIASGPPAGPFKGVPLALKEFCLHARGVTLDMGSRFARGFVVDADSELMARLRRAGLVLVATTQLPEFAYSPTTESVLHGATRNPWDPSRSAGGSSGGSGAAVASGMVPIAYGNDGGGSIRVPAACNGIVGLKPSRDRVPGGPDVGDLLCGLGCEFALTRSVRDAAALLDAVAGADPGAPGIPPAPPRPFLEETTRPPGRLRVAFSTTPASGAAIDPECVAAVHATARLLADLGHEVVEDAPRYDWPSFLEATHVLFMSATAALLDGLAAQLGRTPGPDNLEAVTLDCYAEGKRLSAVDLHRALAWGNVASRAAGAFFAGCDVLVTPTLARPPIPLGELDQSARGVTAWQWTERIFAYVCFTALFNWTGQPAVSLPLHWTPDGLPVGVQLVTRLGDEATLLRVAAQLEQARPWARRRPPIHASRPV